MRMNKDRGKRGSRSGKRESKPLASPSRTVPRLRSSDDNQRCRGGLFLGVEVEHVETGGKRARVDRLDALSRIAMRRGNRRGDDSAVERADGDGDRMRAAKS